MRLHASLLAIVALSLLSCAAAQTYYVSTGGNNPACTQATPCGTLLVATTLAGGTTATIVMNPGTYTSAGNYGLSFGAVGNQRITINGTGAIIDCGGNGGFSIAGSQSLGLSINGLTMRNCRPALKFDGAAADGTFSGMTFDSNGQLGVSSAVTLRPQSGGSLFRPTFTQCTFKNNVGLNGGALQISAPAPAGIPIPANIIMDNCTFINNSATAGGALHATSCCDRGTTFLTRLTFSGNSATLAGAAVYFSSLLGSTAGASADIEDWVVDSSALTAPTSSNAAGVVHIQGSTRSLNRVTISNSAITSSAAGLSSAALYVSGSTVSVSNLVMTNNRVIGTTFADTAGASVLVSSSTISVSNAQISGAVIGNSASPSGRGAAIALFAGASGVNGSMSDSVVSGNRAADGAGLYASSIGQFTFTNVSFSGNTGYRGAAAYLATASAVTFSNCAMSGNALLAPQTTAQGFGGAVAVFDASNLTLSGGTVALNSASYGGGAVYAAANSRLAISNVAFQNNSAAIVGGALMLGANPSQPSVATITASIAGSSFTANRASSGGAIYSSSAAAITIDTTSFTDNAASGSPQSQGGAIYIAGNNTVPVALTLNAQTSFVGNAAPAGASLSLFGVSASLGSATLPAPPGQTACCGTRCIVCDNPSGSALSSSAGVKCPDTVCPTPPPPPPTTRSASNAASGFVPAVAIVAVLLVAVCASV